TLRELKQRGKAAETVGVELDQRAAEAATENVDRVLIGSIEEINLPFSDEYFDVILLLDVLEHLFDPWRAVSRLVPLCRRGGLFIASIPNVCYWRAVLALVLFDRLDYTEEGLLDRTHLRFFTGRSAKQLFADAGLVVEAMLPTRGQGLRLFNTVAAGLSCGLLGRFFTFQYLVKARRP
uniref:class I SAM-dependent methyltransferase n=1 Tax=Thermodesulfitimonas autotrophica TaxID=1894989 RepID=UPI002FDFA7E4